MAKLKKQNATNQVQALWEERDKIAAERDTLAQTLRAIERAMRGGKKVLQTNEGGLRSPPESQIEHGVNANDSPPRDPDTSLSISTSNLGEEALNSVSETWPATAQDSHSDNMYPLDLINVMQSPIFSPDSIGQAEPSVEQDTPINCQDTIVPTPVGTCECSPTPESRQLNLWRFANETLSGPVEWSPLISMREDTFEEDIPIRAMVEGWDAAERRAGGVLPQSWAKLRRIDEILFHICGKTERLAVLRTMHSLFRYHQEPSPTRHKSMPNWYLARYVV